MTALFRRTLRVIGAFCIFGAAAALMAAADVSRGASNADSVFVLSRANDPLSLDPAQQVSVGGGVESLTAFYERLIDLTPQGKLVPSLATSWSVSKDGKMYTLQLRRGVTFHDGTPFNAAAVRFTWQRIMGTNGAAAQYWRNVANVTPAGQYSVAIKLKRVDATFIPTLAGQRGIYMGPSPSAVKAHEAKPGDWAVAYFNDHEAGTGPYTLKSWQHDQQLVYDAYPKYWRGWKGNHSQQIVQKIVKDPSSTRLQMESGQIDLAADALPTDITLQMKKESGIKVVISPTTTFDQFTFNMDRKPTSDPRVRKALSLLFDYNAAIKQAYHGYAHRVYGPIPSTIWPAIPATAPRYNTNIAAAKKLLTQAGYPNGFTLELSTQDLQQWKSLALALQNAFAAANVKVNVSFTTWPALFSKLQKPRGEKPFHMAGYQMWAGIPDPNDILTWWNTNAITVINPGWGNKTTDGWIVGAQTANSKAKRLALYRKLLVRMITDAPAIWIDQPDNMTVMRSNVHGYQYIPYYNGLVDFYKLWKS